MRHIEKLEWSVYSLRQRGSMGAISQIYSTLSRRHVVVRISSSWRVSILSVLIGTTLMRGMLLYQILTAKMSQRHFLIYFTLRISRNQI